MDDGAEYQRHGAGGKGDVQSRRWQDGEAELRQQGDGGKRREKRREKSQHGAAAEIDQHLLELSVQFFEAQTHDFPGNDRQGLDPRNR
ncbi:MAG: hypothetical protein Q8J72_04045, partial [Rhodocyclaceae bacterium]|nr:hypothetical protein [Rhodocyclaceae bacterium]